MENCNRTDGLKVLSAVVCFWNFDTVLSCQLFLWNKVTSNIFSVIKIWNMLSRVVAVVSSALIFMISDHKSFFRRVTISEFDVTKILESELWIHWKLKIGKLKTNNLENFSCANGFESFECSGWFWKFCFSFVVPNIFVQPIFFPKYCLKF